MVVVVVVGVAAGVVAAAAAAAGGIDDYDDWLQSRSWYGPFQTQHHLVRMDGAATSDDD
jgi:hypothetical protein